jgi:putative FmdB family regulatory protein
MPLYVYRCPNGHTFERLRKYTEREDLCPCIRCEENATPLPTAPHVLPDGCYSYAPNLGTMRDFDRKQYILDQRAEAKKDGRNPNKIDMPKRDA